MKPACGSRYPKSTIEKNDDRDRSWGLDRVDRTLGLKILAKNISMRPFDEGLLEWTIIIERWGYSPSRYERYKGMQKLDPLKPGESVNLTAGESSIGGYGGYNKRYQDKMEAWQVVVKHASGTTISVQSGSSFDRLYAKAKDASPE